MPSPPEIRGGALIIPAGLLARLQGRAAVSADDQVDAEARKRIEHLAMQSVMQAEKDLGYTPRDVSATKGIGHDIESGDSQGKLRFIEVKVPTKSHSLLTRVRCAVNTPDQFILAVAIIDGEEVSELSNIRHFPFKEPGFGQVAAAYQLKDLLQYGGSPA